MLWLGGHRLIRVHVSRVFYTVSLGASIILQAGLFEQQGPDLEPHIVPPPSRGNMVVVVVIV